MEQKGPPNQEGILRLKICGQLQCTHWITYYKAAYLTGGIWIKQTMIQVSTAALHTTKVSWNNFTVYLGSEHMSLETGHAFLS